MSDAEALAAALSNPHIQCNLRDGLPYPYAVRDAEAYISECLSAQPDEQWTFAVAVDDRAAGSIGIFRKENIHRLTAELGYYLAEEFWGEGIMSWAVQAACEEVFAKSDLERIFAEPFATNGASCRVLEKAGFAFEGTLRRNAVKNGKVRDMKIYSLLRPANATQKGHASRQASETGRANTCR